MKHKATTVKAEGHSKIRQATRALRRKENSEKGGREGSEALCQ